MPDSTQLADLADLADTIRGLASDLENAAERAMLGEEDGRMDAEFALNDIRDAVRKARTALFGEVPDAQR